jgi:hypothetical protein
MSETEEVTFRALRAVVMLLGNEELQQILQDKDHFQEALHTMGIPESARGEMLNLLTRVERLQARAAGTSGLATRDSLSHEPDNTQNKKYEKMQLEVFGHIRTSFWVALIMSIVLFLLGLLLMGIGVSQALRESSVSTSTLTIAGLGLADFVLLFFRQPWQDVAVNLSNSQRARTITTSYLVGLTLLHRGDTKSLELLDNLTKRSVVMLGQDSEKKNNDRKDTSKATES